MVAAARLTAKERHSMDQSVSQTDLRFPAEPLAGTSNIWLALAGIILRKRLVRDAHITPNYAKYLLCQLPDGKFDGIAQVYRLVPLLGRHQPDQTIYHFIHVAE